MRPWRFMHDAGEDYMHVIAVIKFSVVQEVVKAIMAFSLSWKVSAFASLRATSNVTTAVNA